MPRKRKKNNGIGAKCQCLTRFLHPRAIVDAKYPNATQRDRLSNLLTIKKEKKQVNKVEKLCIVFRHDDFPNIELHCTERYANVLEEGAEPDFFEAVEQFHNEEAGAIDANQGPIERPELGGSNVQEDIARLRLEGHGVDDDNDPAPENIPDILQATAPPPSIYQGWNSCPNICHRAAAGLMHERPKLGEDVCDSNTASYMDYMIYFLPRAYIMDVLLEETNAIDEEIDDITWGEFLVYIGLWFLMATTVSGCDRRSYWQNSAISPWKGAPYRFNEYMSYSRFDYITQSLTFTNVDPPNYRDKIHEVQQMITAFNDHMQIIFIPSWISCLDESMSIWTSRWTCPGWMYVPRKPHPQGNEYHSIACGLSGILYALELVEGKDRPSQRPNPEFQDQGKTASLLLRLCKCLYRTGKVVILDSGFCVLQAIIALKKMGVYSSALVKKRRYWPKHIKGDDIKADFEDVDTGVTMRLPGELDGEKFDLFCLKEPDYVMTLMSTYGSLNKLADQKESVRELNGETTRFYYNEVVGNHYRYRDAIDAHNAKRHDCGTKHGLSLEETWKTTRWPCRAFSFILAVVEVNAYLAMVYFGGYKGTQWEWRKKMVYELLHNHLDTEGDDKMSFERRILRSTMEHKLITAPKSCKFYGGSWKKDYKFEYQQHHCITKRCKKRIRTVCTCSKDVWRCNECYVKHYAECNIDMSL